MKTELTQILFEKYPNQFTNLKYIECGDGWYEIISRCCNCVQNHLDYLEKQNKTRDFYWTQIKEKFSMLRMYNYGADEYIRGVEDMACIMSGCICEYSGNKGKIRHQRIDPETRETVRAWVKCMSDDVAKQEGYI